MRHPGSTPRNKMRWSFLSVAAATLGALFISGCGGAPSQPTSSAARQVLRMGAVTYQEHGLQTYTLDPTQSLDPTTAFITSLLFPPLLTVDAHLQLEPWAATSIPSYSASANTYTFVLSPHLTWSDGTTITASTYAYSLNRALSPCTSSPDRQYLYPILYAQVFASEACAADGSTVVGSVSSLVGRSLLVVDSQTLVIHLTAPAPYFLYALTTPVAFAQPQQLITRYGSQGWTKHLTDDNGFGGNLYVVKSWDIGAPTYREGYATLTCREACQASRFPRWGNHSAPPTARTIDISIYSTAAAENSDYQAGRLDTETMLTPLDGPPPKTAHLQNIPAFALTSITLNARVAPFNDLRVRQAFALALDKNALAQEATQGSVLPTNHLVPQGMSGFNPSLVGPDGSAGTSGNLAQAQALMRQYVAARCGGQVSGCPPVAIQYPCGAPQYPAEQAYLQNAVRVWQQAFPGYPLALSVDSFGCGPGYMGNPPLLLWTTVAEYADPQSMLSDFEGAPHSSWAAAFPAATLLLDEADQNLSVGQRINQYHQAEQLLVTNGAAIALAQGEVFFASHASVSGFDVTGLGFPTLDQMYDIHLD